MGLSVKERYARLDTSKLPKEINDEFDNLKSWSGNFSHEDIMANDKFSGNFDMLYDIVTSKYPDAITKGGTIVRKKPARVKKVSPKKGVKTEEEFALPKKIDDEIRGLSKRLSADDIEFIESTLTNDEASTDEELVAHFVEQTGITEAAAKKWVKLRNKYLKQSVEEAVSYKTRTELKKGLRGKKARKRLNEDEIEAVEKIITDNKKLSDAALVDLLMKHTDLTKAQAEKWVAKRGKFEGVSYKSRKAVAQKVRKEKDSIVTRDGFAFDRKDPKMKGKKFFDENGKEWQCVRYSKELDECIFKDSEGKEISGCMRDMYVSNPVEKREKGNLVDECKETLKEAGYTVKVHKKGTKKVSRREPRPDKEIIKERVGETFTPILKDIANTDEKKKENKDVIDALGRVEKLFVRLFNKLSNLADDGKADAIKKIEKLLKELLGE